MPTMSVSTQSTGSSTSDTDARLDSEMPTVHALFLIRFDKKVGYTIAWKRTATDIGLENAVEFKSLPSGLHATQSDLVYFTHQGYAGLSLFAQGDASADDRNANLISVGVLVRKEGSFDRLGRGWLLASRLKSMAGALAADPGAVSLLEEFWAEQSSLSGLEEEVLDGKEMAGHNNRARAISALSATIPKDDKLPSHHPALSILRYIDCFGPLIFRLQQAALLRKRILFVGSAPIRTACEFVYILSVLSSMPSRDTHLFSSGAEHLMRIPSLFSVGVHDIPYLEQLQNPQRGGHTPGSELAEGWIACTTDEILKSKTHLYDIVVVLPSQYDMPLGERRWPQVRTNDGSVIRASQRDLARYKLLRKELRKHNNTTRTSGESPTDDENDESTSLLPQDRESARPHDDDDDDDDDEEEEEEKVSETYDSSIVEPVKWSRLAYLGFMWWASAGERRAYTRMERETDCELVGDLAEYGSCVETALIAYFHRQSSLLIRTLAQLIEAHGKGEANESEDEDDDDDDDDVVMIDADELSELGLDTWSEADGAFVQEFGALFFGRSMGVKGREVDCCGLRLPMM